MLLLPLPHKSETLQRTRYEHHRDRLIPSLSSFMTLHIRHARFLSDFYVKDENFWRWKKFLIRLDGNRSDASSFFVIAARNVVGTRRTANFSIVSISGARISSAGRARLFALFRRSRGNRDRRNERRDDAMKDEKTMKSGQWRGFLSADPTPTRPRAWKNRRKSSRFAPFPAFTYFLTHHHLLLLLTSVPRSLLLLHLNVHGKDIHRRRCRPFRCEGNAERWTTA